MRQLPEQCQTQSLGRGSKFFNSVALGTIELTVAPFIGKLPGQCQTQSLGCGGKFFNSVALVGTSELLKAPLIGKPPGKCQTPHRAIPFQLAGGLEDQGCDPRSSAHGPPSNPSAALHRRQRQHRTRMPVHRACDRPSPAPLGRRTSFSNSPNTFVRRGSPCRLMLAFHGRVRAARFVFRSGARMHTFRSRTSLNALVRRLFVFSP
jgi:hypothetical protein